MANASIAALRITRNDVADLHRIFDCVFKFLRDNAASNCNADNNINDNINAKSKKNCKRNCLAAIDTLLNLGYKAVTQHGVYSKAYQKHFKIFLRSSCFEKRANNLSLEVENSLAALTKSFVIMLVLAINAFARLGYLTYYEDFVRAVKVLFDSEAVRSAGLGATAARLASVIFSAIIGEC